MSHRDEILARLGVSRETSERLDSYAALLGKWNKAINLVGPTTISDLWTRHFLDSAQIFRLAPKEGLWLDLGTGGGFPGLVCAILAANTHPELRFGFVESDQRKCAFLSTVLRETGVSAEIHASRIEDLPPLGAAIVSARALAPLDTLLTYTHRHLFPSGRGIFLKGAKHEEEVSKALENWTFDVTTHPSETDPAGTILTVGNLARV